MNIIEGLKEKGAAYLLVMFSFCLPLGQRLSTVVILLSVLVSLVFFKKSKFLLKKELLFLTGLYMVYVLSLIYTDNFGFKYFEQKASLLAFPLIFFLNGSGLLKETIEKSLLFFVYGCVLSGLYSYYTALTNSLSFIDGIITFQSQINTNSEFLESSIRGGNFFFGSLFSSLHHTTYFSMFVNLAISILLFKKPLFRSKIIRLSFLVFLSIVLIQVSSRAGLITLLIIYVFYFFKSLSKPKFFTLLFLLLISSFIVSQFNPRIKKTVVNLIDKGLSLDNEDVGSMSQRFMTWDASLEIIKKSPIIGVGIGDTYHELKQVYRQKRYIYPYRERLNSHNQYLQLLVECGIFGLLLFCFTIKNLIVRDKSRDSNYIIMCFTIIIVFNGLFESILNQYSGLAFFCFFYCLFMFYKGQTKRVKEGHIIC
ncbi:O-antigen ligase [Winogradskyella sp.]|uniref:O-antigen ligase family protein n=1 Tax=Winogradskyella sp. TaxID=1883156 RepID=UPI0025F09D62|nr:O-antigen ligase family protein [Winogradskyella sp.]